MIEIARARSGAALLKKNDRFLGSAYDPAREGEAWADRAERQLSAFPGATQGFAPIAMVLGLGSGYGALALARRIGFERVLILEPDVDVVKAAATLPGLSEIARARIACGEDPEAALGAPDVLRALRGPICLLANGSAVDANPAWHRRAQELLIGRRPFAFRWALRARPEVAAALDGEALDRWLEPPEGAAEPLVSINTIEACLRLDAIGREAMIWRALGEFVA